jgi:hypothetical protein
VAVLYIEVVSSGVAIDKVMYREIALSGLAFLSVSVERPRLTRLLFGGNVTSVIVVSSV